jgi:hypothetical protein
MVSNFSKKREAKVEHRRASDDLKKHKLLLEEKKVENEARRLQLEEQKQEAQLATINKMLELLTKATNKKHR